MYHREGSISPSAVSFIFFDSVHKHLQGVQVRIGIDISGICSALPVVRKTRLLAVNDVESDSKKFKCLAHVYSPLLILGNRRGTMMMLGALCRSVLTGRRLMVLAHLGRFSFLQIMNHVNGI